MPYPPISTLPPAPQRSDAPDTFANLADAFVAALSTFRAEINALAAWEQANADATAASAASALAAPGTSGTSTTSLAVGTGSKTLIIQTGKSIVVGMFVVIASTATPTTYMAGQVTAYNSGTGSLTVNVTNSSGSGTYTAWTVSLSSQPVVGVATPTTDGLMSATDKVKLDENSAPGRVVFFARSSAPSGWLKCNGAAISRSTYAALFTAIGTTFGGGNGSTTFNLPDSRGEFIRSWDDARGIDPGRTMGSNQAQNVQPHNHEWFCNGGPAGSSQQGLGMFDSASYTRNNPTELNTGIETRPRNIALLGCIKY